MRASAPFLCSAAPAKRAYPATFVRTSLIRKNRGLNGNQLLHCNKFKFVNFYGLGYVTVLVIVTNNLLVLFIRCDKTLKH